MRKVVEGVKCFFYHVCLLLLELADDVEEMRLGCRSKKFSQSFGHRSRDLQDPNDHIDIAVVDESPNELGYVSNFRVCQLGY